MWSTFHVQKVANSINAVPNTFLQQKSIYHHQMMDRKAAATALYRHLSQSTKTLQCNYKTNLKFWKTVGWKPSRTVLPRPYWLRLVCLLKFRNLLYGVSSLGFVRKMVQNPLGQKCIKALRGFKMTLDISFQNLSWCRQFIVTPKPSMIFKDWESTYLMSLL